MIDGQQFLVFVVILQIASYLFVDGFVQDKAQVMFAYSEKCKQKKKKKMVAYKSCCYCSNLPEEASLLSQIMTSLIYLISYCSQNE